METIMEQLNDPRDCQHVLTYDHASAIVYCPRCMWWWSAEYESPAAQPQGSADPTRVCKSADEQRIDTILNPDNEPTSEHSQYHAVRNRQ